MTASRLMLLVGGLMGFAAVVLAAAGSHMVPGLESHSAYRSWHSANSLHLLHAILLIVLGTAYRPQGGRSILLAAALITAGIVIFSGSIYISLATSMAGASRFAPMGGTMLILGWLMIVAHALGRSRP